VVAAINNLATTGRNGKGVLVLFASANNDHTINGVSALAQLDTVMAIGGTNSNNEHTEFSDVGPEMALATPTNDRGDDGVRLPWLNITSVDNTGSSGYNGLPDLDYTNDFGGTSAATPIAAGLLALILSHDENMTSAQVRAIAQHTAVRIDEPYGRFDPITGHSHRYGYGRGDAAAAIAAVAAGIRWPDRIRSLTITGAGNDISMFWSTPAADYAGSLLVRSNKPFGWMPTDGQTYTVGQEVAPGVTVIYNGVVGAYTDVGATTGGFFYAVYPRSPANYYGFGAKGHLIRNGATVFYDNSEIIDPGWTHGGLRDEWTRGTPTSSLGIFGQVVNGSGPLAGTRGFRAINGNRCWGTDMQSTYNANADAWLQTPIINLTGVNVPVFLEYWDWSLLETFYDRCTVEAVDADGNFLGYIDPDTCGDYDWTQRVYDLTPYAGQAIRVRFRLTSDSILQRDGWFIDEVRVTVAENVPLPPTATPIYTETTENTAKPITLTGSDPNVGTTLAYVITSLPTNGQLSDPEAGPITTVPYTLAGNFRVVIYTPNSDYQGPESFTYQVFDGGLSSNNATVKVSVGTPVEIYNFPLTTDPGWITEGFWAFGKPNGIGGDPTSGNTGLNVYGYNLNGQYANDIKAESLIMAPINCTGLSRVTLSFARWLGVESGNFDNASIEVSADGVNWSPVWANGSTAVIDTSWSIQTFNIGAVADDQPFVQVRWVMGPTDSNTTYAGWNIDDVRILAIGTPAGNQPPMARPVNGSTATSTMIALDLDGADPDDEDLSYTITSLPLFGTISDPNGGEITTVPYTLPPGFRTVEYLPDADFGGFDEFNYQVSDGELNSNVARVVIEVLNPAPFPFEEDFEGGPVLVSHWSTNSTGVGRILVTDRYEPKDNWHIVLDSGAESSYALNELTLVVDLEGQSNVLLYYDWKDFADEVHPAPNSWVGSIQGDAVAISTDGSTWYKLADLHDPNKAAAGDEEAEGGLRAAAYQTVLIDLDDAMAAFGLNYSQTVRIRFIQYDNNPVESDGLALDNIRVVQGTDDPLIVTSVLPEGTVNEPYPPFQIDTFGGDLPLVWTMPTIFTEESLGAQPFPTGGVAQNWRADDAAFDYTLPFPFPFYGGSYTDLKIATDGWINFGPYVGSTYNNSTAALMANKRIAVMWDDLRTDKPGGDIYVDESVPGQVTFRWAAATRNALGNTPCNFAATLFDDGTIRLDYGSGNTPLTPTVGLSAGDNSRYFLTSYDGAASLGDAASLFLDFSRLPPGMSMDAAGVVSGTPTDAGVFHPLIIIEDQRGRSDQKVLTITVRSDLFGDFDGDGDIDLVDLGSFVACLEAPAPDGDCLEAFDADGSAIVDLYDFAAFQRAFTE
jgi:hypothetical protein